MYIKWVINIIWCGYNLQSYGYKLDFFFSDLRYFKIVDKNGVTIGVPTDALLALKDFSIDSLILIKSFYGKMLKDANYKQISKYFIPMSTIGYIDSLNKVIILNESIDGIKYINMNFTGHEETIQYFKLKEIPIYSKSDEKIGTIVDIYYPSEDTCQFVVVTSVLREFFEKLHLVPNHNLMVPEHLITHLSESKIQINVDKSELVKSLAQSLRNSKENKEKDFIQVINASDFSTATFYKIR